MVQEARNRAVKRLDVMGYRAVIFDLDGTLLNTLEDLGDSMNRVLTKKGFPPHDLQAYRHLVGDGSLMLVKRALPDWALKKANIHACLDAFLAEYGRNWDVKTRLYDGVPEMLDSLAEMGVRMAVLSNKPKDLTRQNVSKFLSNWTFDMVLGNGEDMPLKPDPAGALGIAQHLAFMPKECLFLGDTAIDIRTAAAANMFPVGALWGFRPEELRKLENVGALIKQPDEILRFFSHQGRGVSA